MDEKRNCIFTDLPATSKIKLTSSKHNWAKSVPCSKDFIKAKGSRSLNELEFRLVELFYEQELARLRIEHYETQMNEIRALLYKPESQIYKKVELTKEDKEWLNAPLGPLKEKLEKSFDEIRGEIVEIEPPKGVEHYLSIKEQVEQPKDLTEESEDDRLEQDIWS